MQYLDFIIMNGIPLYLNSVSSFNSVIDSCIIIINYTSLIDVNNNIFSIVTSLYSGGFSNLTGLISMCDKCNFYVAHTLIENSVSQNFNYESFLRSSQRMINYINTNSCTNAYTDFFSKKNYIINTNMWNDIYSYLLYLFFVFFQKHLAYFIALIYFIITYILSNIASLNLLNNKLSVYLFLLLLQVKPVLSKNIKLTNDIISGLGWFFYINLMAVYDLFFKNLQSKHATQTLFIENKVNKQFLRERLFLGFLFLLVINTGVLFSNSFYNSIIIFISIEYKILAIVLSFLISTIASVGWIYATNRKALGFSFKVIILSYIRSLCESFAFNALSFANYIIWTFVPQTNNIYIITFICGLLSYFLFSFIQIMFEMNLKHIFIYGLLYNLVFTSLSVSSSALYLLMGIPNAYMWVKILLIIISMVIIVLLPLEVYRYRRPFITLGNRNINRTLVERSIGRIAANNRVIIILIGVLYQLIVFFGFAIGTFIWLDLVGLTL